MCRFPSEREKTWKLSELAHEFWFDEKFQSIDQTRCSGYPNALKSRHYTNAKKKNRMRAHTKQSVAKIRQSKAEKIEYCTVAYRKKGNIIRKINAKITQLFIKKTQIIQPFLICFCCFAFCFFSLIFLLISLYLPLYSNPLSIF